MKTTNGNGNETTPLTGDQKKALFEAYDQAVAKRATAQKKVDDAVSNIADMIGCGPFRWNGVELRIAKRGDRMTMKSNASDVEEIGT